MACSQDFIDFVLAQMQGVGTLRSRKMFGEWMLYVNDKPLLLCCDNNVYIKKLPQLAPLMGDVECGTPYDGAKEHYILDVGHKEHARRVVSLLESVTPLPAKKKKKSPQGK